jgi:Ras-related protein Rab-1A
LFRNPKIFALVNLTLLRGNDPQYKVLVLGESTVGKSSLLLRYVDNTFSGDFMATVGIDFKFKTVLHKDKLIKLQIWDTVRLDY